MFPEKTTTSITTTITIYAKNAFNKIYQDSVKMRVNQCKRPKSLPLEGNGHCQSPSDTH